MLISHSEVIMSVKTNNIYGEITISNKTIARYIETFAFDCYGVVEFVPKNRFNKMMAIFKHSSYAKGVKVRTTGDRINIDISIIVKYGVSINAVVESLKESVKYRVEKFTGMLVGVINVRVFGVKN